MNKEVFNGFDVDELLKLWKALQSDNGAPIDTPREKMIALNDYLRSKKLENTVFSKSHAYKKPLF